MSTRTLIVLVICATPLFAQTTGMPGVNDMTVNGFGSGGTSPVPTGLPGGEGGLTWAVSGAGPNPVIGLGELSPVIPGVLFVPGSGALDLLFSGDVLFDGTGTLTPVNILTPAFWINSTGVFALTINVNLVAGFNFSMQTVSINPANPNGFWFSQAHDVTASSPPFAACPATIGGGLAPLSDDGFIQVPLTGNFSFYGASYTDVFVNMNGNCTFGAGDTDFAPSEGDLLSGGPRIAVWDDWSPNDPLQGDVRTFEDVTTFAVEWYDVRTFGFACTSVGDTNTFCISMDKTTGAIDLSFAIMSLCLPGAAPSTDQVVGISPGGGLSTPNNVDLSLSQPATASPLDALYEDFGQGIFGPFDLGVMGPPVNTRTFNPTGGVGIGPYEIL